MEALKTESASSSREVVDAYHRVADLMKVKPHIYWTDMLLSSLIGWGAFVLGCRTGSLLWAPVAVLALYRSAMFIHELTHLRKGALPGFRWAWNLALGIPVLIPSFFYIGVHLDHHNPKYYGTKQDPEYAVLCPGTVHGVLFFLITSALLPVGAFLRFGLLAPLSLLSKNLRRFVVESCSSLVINPHYKREWPRNAQEQREWILQEVLASAWCLGNLGAVAAGIYPARYLWYFLAMHSGIAVVNQLRTLVAHRFEEHQETLSIEGQLLDSLNYPGQGLFPELWAPVGLRYHALHHFLPGLPYHAFGEAHKRLTAELPAGSAYHRASSRGFWESVRQLFKSPLQPI